MMGLDEIKKANEDPEKYAKSKQSDGQKKPPRNVHDRSG